MSSYLSWIEGPPPKRNAPGSSPGEDATNNAEILCFQGISALLISGGHLLLESILAWSLSKHQLPFGEMSANEN